MKMRSVVLGAICLFFSAGVCFGEFYISRKGLFKIDVPEGWDWIDQSDTVIIPSTQQEGAIIIKMQPRPAGNTPEETDKLLDGGMKNMILKVKEEKGIIISEKPRSLDGLRARQVDFLVKDEQGKLHATFMALYAKGYFVTIYLEGVDEAARKKMEQIVETMRFLGR